MKFTVSFFNDGVPDDTLSPVINIWEAEAGGNQVATNKSMDLISIGSGGYVYDLLTADNSKSYYGEAYASTLPEDQRYAPCITTVQGNVADVLEDTGTTLPDQLDLIQAETDKIQTVDDNVDLVLEDTGTTIPDQLDLIQTETDKISAMILAIDQTLVDTTFIKAIEGGKWTVVNNQMIFYAEDNITEVARFDLFDGLTPSITDVSRRERVIT